MVPLMIEIVVIIVINSRKVTVITEMVLLMVEIVVIIVIKVEK